MMYNVIDPGGRPAVKAGSDHCFCSRQSVRPSIPTFQNKTNIKRKMWVWPSGSLMTPVLSWIYFESVWTISWHIYCGWSRSYTIHYLKRYITIILTFILHHMILLYFIRKVYTMTIRPFVYSSICVNSSKEKEKVGKKPFWKEIGISFFSVTLRHSKTLSLKGWDGRTPTTWRRRKLDFSGLAPTKGLDVWKRTVTMYLEACY